MPDLHFEHDLRLDKIERIMPDTWKNISWVIINAFQLLIEKCCEGKEDFDILKLYTTEANRNLHKVMIEMIDFTKASSSQFQTTIEKNATITAKEIKDMQYNIKTTTEEMKEQNATFSKNVSENMMDLNIKMEAMQTADVLRAYTE